MRSGIFLGDALKLDLDSRSINLIVTHPPYFGFSGDRYGGEHDKQIIVPDHKKVVKSLVKATKEMERVLADDGNILICIGDVAGAGTPYHYVSEVLKKTNLACRGFFYWDYSSSEIFIEFRNPDTPVYENINPYHNFWIHLSKKNFNHYFDERVLKQNWGTEFVSNEGQELDKELAKGDVAFGSIGDTYPIGWAHKFINLFSRPGDFVLDPFGGTGLTAQAAIENKRSYICVDISTQQTEVAKRRIELYYSDPQKYGTLK